MRELGLGFLTHAGNEALRQSLQNGNLSAADYYRQLLSLAYRILLLLAHEADGSPTWKDENLMARALEAWHGGNAVAVEGREAHDAATGTRSHRAPLLASHLSLFGPHACRDLDGANCGHDHLLKAVRQLGEIVSAGDLRTDRSPGQNLEQLGSIHEAMLASRARVVLAPTLSFELTPGAERKRTGSYYTPPELVQELITSALDPVIESRLRDRETTEAREEALLSLRICDPACGCGHFLLAAARRLARELARVRSGDVEPNGETYGAALAAVLSRCIYGVDRDPLAVDLCLVRLWNECRDPSVLECLSRRIKSGDSLVGVLDVSVIDGSEQSGPPSALDRTACDRWTERKMGSAGTYPSFHWPLEFQEAMQAGGFDVVLANPPWEMLQPEEVAFFRMHDRQDVANLAGIDRKTSIREACRNDRELAARWVEYRCSIASQSRFMRESGRYPLTSTGRLNVYSLFMETIRAILRSNGRAGCIVPSGLITDDSTKQFFHAIVDSGELVSLRHFDNRADLFPGVGSAITFCLMTLTGSESPCAAPQFSFYLHRPEDLRDPVRQISLDRQDIRLLNPNTRTCPVFRSGRDAELVKAIYRRVPILAEDGRVAGDGWGIELRQGLFNMTTSSHLFRSREDLETDGWELEGNVFRRSFEHHLPLYEAKMMHHFDHRWRSPTPSGGARREDPTLAGMPRYWVSRSEVEARLAGRWERDWLLGCRLVCRSTDERTVIGSILPRTACGNSVLLLYPARALREAPLPGEAPLPARAAVLLIACLSSFVLDYAARQKLGGINLNFHILKQLPVLPPSAGEEAAPWCQDRSLSAWLAPRVLALVYTSWDLQPFARDLAFEGPPFEWDLERRRALRCELDAAFFHLYGVARQDVSYIMDTFPIVKRKEQRSLGEYRSRRLILECYDAMQRVMAGGGGLAPGARHQG